MEPPCAFYAHARSSFVTFPITVTSLYFRQSLCAQSRNRWAVQFVKKSAQRVGFVRLWFLKSITVFQEIYRKRVSHLLAYVIYRFQLDFFITLYVSSSLTETKRPNYCCLSNLFGFCSTHKNLSFCCWSPLPHFFWCSYCKRRNFSRVLAGKVFTETFVWKDPIIICPEFSHV